MSLNTSEQFQKLLEQIDYPQPNEPSFAEAEIKKVVVHKKSKTWAFSFRFKECLPFPIFQEFYNHLQVAFSSIATVSFEIETQSSKLDSHLIANYWDWIVKNSHISSPLTQELCGHNLPYMNDGRVIFAAQNEVVQGFLTSTALGPIESTYKQYGFPEFSIHTIVDESDSQSMIKELKAKKEKSDAALAQKASQAILKQTEKRQKKAANGIPDGGPVRIGKQINPDAEVTRLEQITQEERSVVVEGYIFDAEVRTLRSKRQLLIFKVTDYSSSITVKKFSKNESEEQLFSTIQKGLWVKVRGSIQEDTFMRDLTLNAYDVMEVSHPTRQDTAPADKKRAELHLHTNMSQMDATNNITDFVKQAAKWGQKAIAVTDHSGLQAFPDAYAAGKKNNVKILYGVEANLVDDGVPIGYNDKKVALKGATYVVFDTETTGLSAIYDKVIELSAVKMQDGNVIDQFEEFIDPGFHLSDVTTNLTSITDQMVHGSKSEKEVFSLFRDFYKDAIIVGHNVTFDIGFMDTGYARYDMPPITNPIIDTLTLARFLYPTLKSYRLNTLAKKFGVSLEHHHRAIYDAESTGHLCHLFLKDAEDRYHINYHSQLNEHMTENDAYKHARPAHAVLIAQTQAGLKNLFRLVSLSNVKYYYRVPRIPKSELERLRDGILVGSACSTGEVFTAMMQKGKEEAKQKAKFYDYLEVMAKPVYQPEIEQGLIQDNRHLEEIISNIVDLGKELKKPVVATGDVHYLNPEDYIYRKILINSQGGANPLNRSKLPDVHFRTTNEMLDEFAFLGKEKAEELVVTNPGKIVDMVTDVKPVKDKLYTPKMPGAEDQIEKLTMDKAHELYGDPLPQLVKERLDKELKSIIGNGFSVIYLIAQRLVHKSNKDGYLVGSRGSVGSSLVATMSGITEVNPLPPHYRCPNCQYTKFYTKGEYGSGFDLPDEVCPNCQTPLVGDGQDIPLKHS